MSIPEELKYTVSHEWIKVKDNIGTVGITDYAQDKLGDVVFVELPKVGAELEANSEVAVIESVKTAADVYTPLSGKIVKVNTLLDKDPSFINSDPYNKGWIFEIQIKDVSELEKLMDSTVYQNKISED
ncbi:MAG: glycine cleavage system protein GcvH [Candidatus Aureabacteria bacterium]|nr:glycine cleavage system protein GcvH [Candidatus Auribacterota bacterium]